VRTGRSTEAGVVMMSGPLSCPEYAPKQEMLECARGESGWRSRVVGEVHSSRAWGGRDHGQPGWAAGGLTQWSGRPDPGCYLGGSMSSRWGRCPVPARGGAEAEPRVGIMTRHMGGKDESKISAWRRALNVSLEGRASPVRSGPSGAGPIGHP
jgi:hypothetical protein